MRNWLTSARCARSATTANAAASPTVSTAAIADSQSGSTALSTIRRYPDLGVSEGVLPFSGCRAADVRGP
ncbi:hypothetical protein GCM10009557_64130 [Virgisporangium ochraceum]|uniref:Uncharacterized protein n=1 Tax=Virgisporangium ochraceum TaxID=65505 RepID=A0A8J3ZU77_9ACTN|nr:hypothetical protein Voc01_030550 [Virgisporangium ochraceum]